MAVVMRVQAVAAIGAAVVQEAAIRVVAIGVVTQEEAIGVAVAIGEEEVGGHGGLGR